MVDMVKEDDYTYFNAIGNWPDAQFRDVPITISEFMKKIEENIGIMKKGKWFRLSWDDVHMKKNYGRKDNERIMEKIWQ